MPSVRPSPSRSRRLSPALLVVAVALLAGCGAEGRSALTQTPAAASHSAEGIQARYVDVVKRVSPAVVQIQTPTALGSGIVFDHRGDVVTNAHVIAGAKRFRVTLAGGRSLPATLVGTDRGNDIGVLHISGTAPAPASFADSSRIVVGDIALAIGNPLGLHSSVTEGIVSSLARTVSEGNGVTLTSTLQTSAEINPGNSGGALADLDGRIIGIPTLAALDPQLGNAQAPGIGFAITSNRVKSVASAIISQQGGAATP
jgi:S1-C subfamily serine protease